MSSLDEIKQSFETEALKLGDYEKIPKIDLFNGYCDAEESKNEIKRNQYFAALMLRYWSKIFKWAQKCQSLNLEITEYVNWLYECLNDVMYYKAWRNEYLPNGEVNKYYWKLDPASADRSMNFFCNAQYGKEYQKTNKDKRRSNYANVSIEGQMDLNGDSALDYLGCMTETNLDGSKLLIETLINKDKYIEALIVDGISNADSFKEQRSRDGKLLKSEFNRRKLMKHLNTIDKDFIKNYFIPEYDIDKDKEEMIYSKLKSLNNGKLYNYLDKIMIQIRDNPDYLSCLV